MSEESTEHLTSREPESSFPSVEELLRPVWQNRKVILAVSVVVGLVTLGINYLIADYYRATASLLPSPEKGKLSALGQLAEVAALAGVNVPGSETARLYPSIITSEAVLTKVIQHSYSTSMHRDPFTLVRYFELKSGSPSQDLDEALKVLRTILTISYDARTGIVTLSLVLSDPELAAQVLNQTIGELDTFMRTKKESNASEQVQWIEVRLKQVEDSLRIAEETLKSFREKNRRVFDSPQLLLQQERLVREVQVSSTIFVELKKQYELAKLEEIKNMTIVSVLDAARPPSLKVGPRRRTNSAIAFMITFMVCAAYVVVSQLYGERVRTSLAQFRKGSR